MDMCKDQTTKIKEVQVKSLFFILTVKTKPIAQVVRNNSNYHCFITIYH